LIGAVSSLQQPSANSEHPVGVVTAISNKPFPELQPASKSGATEALTFASHRAWFDAVSDNTNGEALGTDVPLSRPSTSWQTVITFEGDRDRPTWLSPTKPRVEDRRELVRALQRELQRVRCYDGSIDGEWHLQSKQSMRAFLDRVNAMLPISEPDQILLALVKGQAAAVCGKICPEGQRFAEKGSCLPNAVVAAGAIDKNAVAGSETHPAELATKNLQTDPIAPPTPLLGAMMVGGPSSEPKKLSDAPSGRTPTIQNLFLHPLGGY
jgi:hypothetical protein